MAIYLSVVGWQSRFDCSCFFLSLNSRGGLGFKHQLFEGGLRVPTYVVGVGVPSGRIRTAITAQIDWFPTIVTLAAGDLTVGPPLDGKDIWVRQVFWHAPTNCLRYYNS